MWNSSFKRALEAEFEGDLKLEFHMAPPIFGRQDPKTGRYRKRRFGGWMMKGYAVLARLKFLRGTPFDPFGYDPHRQIERDLIDEYAATMARVLSDIDPTRYDTAVQIAAWPEGIRGYGVVKEEHLEKARAHLASLMKSYFDPEPEPQLLEAAE